MQILSDRLANKFFSYVVKWTCPRCTRRQSWMTNWFYHASPAIRAFSTTHDRAEDSYIKLTSLWACRAQADIDVTDSRWLCSMMYYLTSWRYTVQIIYIFLNDFVIPMQKFRFSPVVPVFIVGWFVMCMYPSTVPYKWHLLLINLTRWYCIG